jgi:hypothetical protein
MVYELHSLKRWILVVFMLVAYAWHNEKMICECGHLVFGDPDNFTCGTECLCVLCGVGESEYWSTMEGARCDVHARNQLVNSANWPRVAGCAHANL